MFKKQMRDFNPEEVTEDMRFVTVGSYCRKFLAEPVSDIVAAVVTVAVFFTRFDKILKKGSEKIGQIEKITCS